MVENKLNKDNTEEVKEVVEEKKETTRKPATKKTTAKKEEVKKEEVVEEPKRAKVKKIDANELITVRSVTKNGLTYISKKTGTEVKWSEYGAEEYMEFGELLTMKASKPRFLSDPFIVIDDEDVAERLGLTKMYSEMIDLQNINGFYSLSLEEMKEKIDKMPVGIKRLVSDRARELVETGVFYDIRKIKLLEKELKIELQLLID